MKRALELVEPLPSKIEDCFAQFDQVFDSLASQLDWQESESREPAAPVQIEPTEETPAPPVTPMALVPPAPPPPAPLPAPPAPEQAADVLQQYERAFSVLDEKLAESDGADAAKLTERPTRRLPSDRMAAMKTMKMPTARRATPRLVRPKRVRRATRTFDEVFALLDSLSNVRRRDQLADDRQVLERLLNATRELCADLELPSARVRVEFAVLTLENDHFDKLGSELDELARHIRHDLRFCSIGSSKRNASR